MFYIKINKSVQKEVLAVCDEEILGKLFEEGDLSLEISENFYKGHKVSKDELKHYLLNFDNINISGKNSIQCAIELEILDNENIIKIKGIPHAQIFSF